MVAALALAPVAAPDAWFAAMRRRLRLGGLLLAMVLASARVRADDAIALDGLVTPHPLGPAVAVLRDPTRALTVADVASASYADRFAAKTAGTDYLHGDRGMSR